MQSHSFKPRLQSVAALLSLLPGLICGSSTGTCTPDFGVQSIIRFELNSNVWASNSSLIPQRGVFIWVGQQQWRTDVIAGPSTYPILAVLSTSHNQTYISTSSNGAQDQPCPDSYTFNSNEQTPNTGSYSDDCCTFNSSYTCHGYYDLETSAPILFETSTDFTGSPEDPATTADLQSAAVKYGITSQELVLSETYMQSLGDSNQFPSTRNAFYGPSNEIFGFVDQHEKQVFGLGLNSTFLNDFYARGNIASRSVGLYYGVPASAGSDLERNGSIVIGGYSTSRLQGNFSSQTYPMGAWKLPRHCLWEIDISKISSGSEASSIKFTACVEPSEMSLVLPSDLYNQFYSSSNSSGLTITLTNGISATIPSSLVSIRPITDADQSPILGAPFLSQVYLFVDYQEKTLSVGLANNTLKTLTDPDTLQCIEHSSSIGDLGWAVGNPIDLTASGTDAATSMSTGKTGGGAGRLEGGIRGGIMALVVVAFALYL